MFDRFWKRRADDEAYLRLTAIGLLVEVAGLAILAFLAWMFNELSGAEQLVSAFVISVGAAGGWLLLIAPKTVPNSGLGRVFLGFFGIVQLALLAVAAAAVVGNGDPRLGIQARAIAFDLAAATFVVLILTGCVRALIGRRRDELSWRRRRVVSRVGLLVAVLCAALGTVAALADTAGIRCATFRFNADRWRSEDGGEVTDRERVADTLIDCDTLIAKNRHEIRSMLGPSDGKTPRARHYFVGTVNGSDAQFLILRFDSASRVSRATLSPPNSD
jgi:hypothetical protein